MDTVTDFALLQEPEGEIRFRSGHCLGLHIIFCAIFHIFGNVVDDTDEIAIQIHTSLAQIGLRTLRRSLRQLQILLHGCILFIIHAHGIISLQPHFLPIRPQEAEGIVIAVLIVVQNGTIIQIHTLRRVIGHIAYR